MYGPTSQPCSVLLCYFNNIRNVTVWTGQNSQLLSFLVLIQTYGTQIVVVAWRTTTTTTTPVSAETVTETVTGPWCWCWRRSGVTFTEPVDGNALQLLFGQTIFPEPFSVPHTTYDLHDTENQTWQSQRDSQEKLVWTTEEVSSWTTSRILKNIYQDDTHHKDDHANYPSEGNKVVGERERKLRLQDHVRPAETGKEKSHQILTEKTGWF